jgi:anti-sigma factor RsiW
MHTLLHCYVDGETDAVQRRIVVAHIMTCRECGDELRGIVMVKHALRRTRAGIDPDTVTRLHSFAALLTRRYR